MTVTVLAFGAAAEAAGRRAWTVDLPEGARVADLLRELARRLPSLAPLLPSLAVAVDEEYAGASTPLHEGAEVALIPPVSGGSGGSGSSGSGEPVGDSAELPGSAADRVWLTEEPLSLDALIARVAHADAGAVATFTGTVRARTRRGGEVRETAELFYEAYGPMALKEMRRIAREAEARWPGARVAMAHRTGRLRPGEASVMIAVSAPHRAGAFEACRFCIDTLKQTVPIWKKDIRPDGTEEWSPRP
ncbi:MAG: molybdenum cofactor biosynthesis protein MoaE [Firmicutes bacterium]|nr:molybdenum cofactor biosynthesis protein MoaE [Bacillota bacterium]